MSQRREKITPCIFNNEEEKKNPRGKKSKHLPQHKLIFFILTIEK